MDKVKFENGVEIDGVKYSQDVLEILGNSEKDLQKVLALPLVNVSRKKAIKLSSVEFIDEFESTSRKARYFLLDGVLLAKDGNIFSDCYVSGKE